MLKFVFMFLFILKRYTLSVKSLCRTVTLTHIAIILATFTLHRNGQRLVSKTPTHRKVVKILKTQRSVQSCNWLPTTLHHGNNICMQIAAHMSLNQFIFPYLYICIRDLLLVWLLVEKVQSHETCSKPLMNDPESFHSL